MNDRTIHGDSSDLAAHDVLAAEEFALPAPDPSIGHPPVVLPEDPSGIAEPHDVLAAEEFALPACPQHPGSPVVGSVRRLWQPAAAAVFALLIARRLLRRARRTRAA
ncbi:MAG TPA: hypothetical protein VG295_09910 [Solirubrobacteraceae bacterium]|nr:hypothetical protein [Solirubrobacteraceae bacterium]